MRFCHFLAISLFFVSLVKSYVVTVGKVTFACYSSSSRTLICLEWQQYKLAQVLNSNLISA